MQVQTGVSDLVLAGGAESMSQAEFYATGIRWGTRAPALTLHDRLARPRVTAGGVNHPVPGGMIETAENLRREYSIARAEQDEFALRSHRLAVAAQHDGTFAQEIVPVTVRGRERRALDRHRRAPPGGHHTRAPGGPEGDNGELGPGGDGHGRQRQRPERRRRRVHRHPPRPGPRAGPAPAGAAGQLGRRGSGAGADGHRPGAREPSGTGAGGPEHGRHGPDRAQRGVRRTGARRPARVGPPGRPGAGSTSTVRGSRSAIRSARPAGGS